MQLRFECEKGRRKEKSVCFSVFLSRKEKTFPFSIVKRIFWRFVLSNWDLSFSPSKGSLQVDSKHLCFQRRSYSNLLLPNSIQFLLWCSQFQKTALLRPEIAAHLAPLIPLSYEGQRNPKPLSSNFKDFTQAIWEIYCHLTETCLFHSVYPTTETSSVPVGHLGSVYIPGQNFQISFFEFAL